MKRDLYFVESAARIREVLAEKALEGLDVATSLGVGFFRAEPFQDGVSVRVVPGLLRPHLLSKMDSGLVSPYSHEIFYFGETSLSVCRWILAGLQMAPPTRDADSSLRKTDWPELSESRSVSDAVGAWLRAVQSRVLDLRASQVVFLLDFEVLTQFFQGWLGVSTVKRSDVILETVSWLADDWLHPNTLLVCDNRQDFSEMVLVARNVRLQLSASAEVLFRF